MQDLDLLILRDTREATKVLDHYVHIANSMFEKLDITNIGYVGTEKIETLASYSSFSPEIFDIRGSSALDCVHFFGLQFLAYIFAKIGLTIVPIAKPEGMIAIKGTFPTKEFSIIWRMLPNVSHSMDFETGDVRYACHCRVLILSKKEIKGDAD